MKQHRYVTVMAGGIGSRFWPASRTRYPKQFLDILGTGKTLIQQTVERFQKLVPTENIYVVTAADYVSIVEEQLPHLPKANIVSEPSRKNTAPCIAYISFKIHQLDPNASMIVAPSDHLILQEEQFVQTCNHAFGFVEHMNALVTLGIKPTYPNTGYGYIQHEPMPVADHIYKVKTFTEKPNLELAHSFIASGDFLWNAGIFVWQVNNILKAFEKLQPEMYEVFDAGKIDFNTPKEQETIHRIYPLCTNISIDYAIMEKAQNVYIIPSNFGWSDLGTWNSAYENLEKDYLGNAVKGQNVMIVDATKCMVSVQGNKLVVLQGIDNCIIADTPDALLICSKDKEQEVKEYLAEIKRTKGDQWN